MRREPTPSLEYMKGAETMKTIDVCWEASELKHSVLSLKAVAENFYRRFVEHGPELNVLAVQTSHEEYEYLYRAMFSLICEVRDKAIQLENAADELHDNERSEKPGEAIKKKTKAQE